MDKKYRTEFYFLTYKLQIVINKSIMIPVILMYEMKKRNKTFFWKTVIEISWSTSFNLVVYAEWTECVYGKS